MTGQGNTITDDPGCSSGSSRVLVLVGQRAVRRGAGWAGHARAGHGRVGATRGIHAMFSKSSVGLTIGPGGGLVVGAAGLEAAADFQDAMAMFPAEISDVGTTGLEDP